MPTHRLLRHDTKNTYNDHNILFYQEFCLFRCCAEAFLRQTRLGGALLSFSTATAFTGICARTVSSFIMKDCCSYYQRVAHCS